MQLLSEAEKIRDGLLQESFTIRRSLEQCQFDQGSIPTTTSCDCLKTVEKLYHSLEQLSDRLSPIHIEHSLPLAIQSVVEFWQSSNSTPKIQIKLPAYWKQETLDRSIFIFKILDELLRITFSELATELSIHISLKQQGNIGELIVQISYPDLPTLISSCASQDLDYLSRTFRFVTLGECFRQRHKLTVAWYFRWITQ